jgi:hypothetical protein
MREVNHLRTKLVNTESVDSDAVDGQGCFKKPCEEDKKNQSKWKDI